MQHNVVVIPKSVTSSRIEENIDVFDFELSADQMKRIDDLNKDQRIGPDPDKFTTQFTFLLYYKTNPTSNKSYNKLQ